MCGSAGFSVNFERARLQACRASHQRPGFQCVRENYLVREDVEHDERGFSRVAAARESPARKCRVKWNQCASPVGTTPVLTHTLQPLRTLGADDTATAAVLLFPDARSHPQVGGRDHGRVSDPLAGMIWRIAGPPDFLSVRGNSQPGSRCAPPDPGSCLRRHAHGRSTSSA
jgi:hypothetical protein